MDSDDFLSGILGQGDHHAAGLDELNIQFAENDESTEEILEVQASGSKNVSRRGKKFDKEEDKVICSGWLNVSKDPIHGANQTLNGFWRRVHDYFEKNKNTSEERSQSSIMHRWLAIQHQVNKFCSCYDAIERRNKSGSTIQDKISEACIMFENLNKGKKTFTMIPCWHILNKEDKWKAKMEEIAELEKEAVNKKKKSTNKTKVSKPREAETTDNGEATDVGEEGGFGSTEPRKRPEGIKKAKENAKRGGGEACMEAFEQMWAKKEALDKEKEKAKDERFKASIEIDREALELEKKRVANEEKRIEADLAKEENTVMFVDKKSLDPVVLEYVELKQKMILDRLKGF